MSQLVKAITAVDTGNRKLVENKFSPLFQDVFARQEHLAETFTVDCFTAKMYRIGVTLGAQCMVSELDVVDNPDALENAIERAKRSIVEAVFGEFRSDFLQIQNALYDRDFQKARTLLTAFEQKMFDIS